MLSIQGKIKRNKQNVMKRKRIAKAYLVASTNTLNCIIAKRLNVEITYQKNNYKILSERVIGLRV